MQPFKILILLPIISQVIGNHLLAQETNGFSTQAIKRDLSYLFKTLEDSHYDLFASTPREKFEEAHKEIEASIGDSVEPLQAFRWFQSFCALSKHGHCAVELPIRSYISYGKQGGTVFPLHLGFLGDRLVILDNLSSDDSVAVGDEVLAINNRPMELVLSNIHHYISGESDHSKNAQIELISFSRYFWIANGRVDKFLLKIKSADGTIQEREIESIPAGQYERAMATKKPLGNTNREFTYLNDVAYLRPGPFYKIPEEKEFRIDGSLLESAEFQGFLQACFVRIQEEDSRALIIDLRGNPGGSGEFSNPLVAYFATEPFVGGSVLRINASKINKDFWRDIEVSSELFKDIQKQVMASDDGTRFEAMLKKHEPRRDSLRFSGKVYVLVDRFSFSEAIVVSSMIQDYKFGVVIGEETSPVMYANARQSKLPNTQMLVTFPAAYFVRPSGDKSLHGTIPDYKVTDNPLTEEDEVLRFALEQIDEDLEVESRDSVIGK